MLTVLNQNVSCSRDEVIRDSYDSCCPRVFRNPKLVSPTCSSIIQFKFLGLTEVPAGTSGIIATSPWGNRACGIVFFYSHRESSWISGVARTSWDISTFAEGGLATGYLRLQFYGLERGVGISVVLTSVRLGARLWGLSQFVRAGNCYWQPLPRRSTSRS